MRQVSSSPRCAVSQIQDTRRHVRCGVPVAARTRAVDCHAFMRLQTFADTIGDAMSGTFAKVDLTSTGGVGNTSSQPIGPPACLLVGFSEKDALKFREGMLEMGADFVKVLGCSSNHMDLKLSQAMFKDADALPLSGCVRGPPRTVFLSGMVGAEVAEVVGMYRDSGMADAVFAVLVPKNADRRIGELVEEVNEDDRKVRKALEEKRKSSLAKDAAMGPKMSEDVV